ncbi:SpoIIE family protein phosphatase [Streptomyces sp. Da 82-17]|uniref:SpoIIE family protein phosphatase n=1 Tax=Streptomyces sp. Da 82-17 TaxID=3377116 RepID=UPI0038D4DB00
MTASNAEQSAEFRGPLDVTRAATVVVDAQDTVIGWSPAAERLLGYGSQEAVGRALDAFLSFPFPFPDPAVSSDAAVSPDPAASADAAGSPDPAVSVEPMPSAGPLPVSFLGNAIGVARRRDGRELVVATAMCPLPGAGSAARVLVATELQELRLWESRLALLRGLAAQSPLGLAIYDAELRLTWCNTMFEREIGRPFSEFRGLRADELYSDGRFVTTGHPPTLDAVMHHVLDTGEPFVDLHFQGRPPSDPETEHVWSCAYYRLQDADGHVIGVCEDAFDISDRYKAQQRLALLVEAGRGIGTALDVRATAEKITEVAVPDFAETVTVDLAPEVLEGEVPTAGGASAVSLVRVAWRSAGPPPPPPPAPPPPSPGSAVEYPPGSPQYRSLSSGGLVLDDTTLVVPLRAGHSTLGLVTFMRGAGAPTFDGGEVALADELAARTAVSVDNARRYTRERTASLTLQRQLLPQHVPEQSAVDLAYRYLPSDDMTGVGGDWFDVIPLSGTRVGLVVGDVVGHGLEAAATMGRLRTTVRAFAQMDLDPVEVLSRLDDLVAQSVEEQWGEPGMPDGSRADVTTGATCLYAVYDPVSRRCVMARAGHLPPVVVDPEGRLSFPLLPAGPPLGVGGLPFESTEIELPVGSLLALFTDGLVETRERDIDHGLDILGQVLTDRNASLEALCDRAVAELLPGGSATDDTALLLVRTRELDASQVTEWELPAERVAAGRARDLATRQLHDWGLEELSFATELVVSELVTNAVRYAEGPIQVRLIRDRTLLCEVADRGHTSPHLRHSGEDDEGGRGLFIVAQLVQRWGTRYTRSGKTIWTEQALPGEPGGTEPGAL